MTNQSANKEIKRNTFVKAERLCSYKIINELFEKGSILKYFPFRVVWMYVDNNIVKQNLQLLIQVPKRNFKRANKRNHIKRLVKECYRTNKHALIEHLIGNNKSIVLAIIFVDKEIPKFNLVKYKINLVLQRLINEIN